MVAKPVLMNKAGLGSQESVTLWHAPVLSGFQNATFELAAFGFPGCMGHRRFCRAENNVLKTWASVVAEIWKGHQKVATGEFEQVGTK